MKIGVRWPHKNVNFSEIFRPISTKVSHWMSNWCRIMYTKFCVDICNGFGVIEKIQEGAGSAPPPAGRGLRGMALNVLWIRQRKYVWSCQKRHIYDFLKCFGGAKNMLPPLSGFWVGPWPECPPLDPPVAPIVFAKDLHWFFQIALLEAQFYWHQYYDREANEKGRISPV